MGGSREELGDRPPFHVPRDQVGDGVLLPRVVHSDDVRVVTERGERTELMPKPGQARRADPCCVDETHRDVAVEAQVTRQVDLFAGAAAEEAAQLIPTG